VATLLALQTLAERPGWYDWPWTAVGAISIIVVAALTLLRLLLKDQFTSPSQFKELKDQMHGELEELKEELKGYEERCDGRTTKFEEKLERNFATVSMVNGVGDRVKAVDDRVTAAVNLTTSARDRADEAHEISRDLSEQLKVFMARMDERFGPMQSDLREIKNALRISKE
jgi:divalent metal cation (Fe/Co/Zn/Cd) transporter